MTCPPNSIPIRDALTAIDHLSRDLPSVNRKFARKELKSLLTALADTQEHIEIDTLKHFLTGFKEAVETGDASSLVTPRGLRVKRIVDVQEFVENKFFLGLKGTVWPSTMQILQDIFHGPNSENIIEVVLGGAIGIGKSMLSEIGIAYLLYKLSCYHDPQKEYGLAPGTSIYFLFQSITLNQAKKVFFNQFTQRIKQSEYFKKHFPFNKEITTELQFPNSITVLPVASGDTAALGLTVFACFPPEQQYLKADGSLGLLEDEEESVVLTIDPISGDVFPAKHSSKAVPMGEKELFELTFDNGDTILCTENQKFLGEDGVWFSASDSTGRSFRYANLPDLRERTSLSDRSPEEHSQHDQFGISEDVSLSQTVLQDSNSESKGEIKGDGYSRVLGVREAVRSDKCCSSSASQDDCCGVRSEVSWDSHEARVSCSKVGGEVPSTCFEATPRPGVQEVFAAGNCQSNALSTCKYAGEAERPGIYETGIAESNGAVCETLPLRAGTQFLDSNAGQEEGNGLGVFGDTCAVRISNTRTESIILKDGVSGSFLDGHERSALGVRTDTDTLSFRGEEVHVSTRLPHSGRSYRGEREFVSQSPQNHCEVEGSSRFASALSSDNEGLKGVGPKHGLQLSESRKGQGDIVRDVERSLSSVTCVRVSKVVRTCVVYDIDCVPETHAFFVKTQRGFLVSHNSAIDELSFMDRVENSTKSRFTGEAEYDQASSLYNTMSNRIFSRFMRKGHVPGKLFLASSANYPGDFVDRKVAEAAEIDRSGRKNHIYVSLRTTWDAWPKGTYSEAKFPVEVGDATRRSKVLEDAGDAIDPGSVIYVPVDFKDRFYADCERCLREVAGIPVGGSNSFIKQREKIHLAAKAHTKLFGGQQLFKRDSIDLSQVGANVGILINQEFLELWNDSLAEYYCHLDLALSGDSCGITVGHLGGMKEVGKSFEYDEGSGKYAESAPGQKPIIIADGVLEIVPPQADEIDLNLIGDFLEALATRINLTYVTADSYQSASILQRIRKIFNYKGKRIKAAVLSVDRSVAPYAEVKQALRDDRILFPDCEKLQTELRELEFDSKKNKIDHPPGGGKDVSDSLAGVVYLVQTIGVKQRNFNSPDGQKSSFRRIRSGRAQIYK